MSLFGLFKTVTDLELCFLFDHYVQSTKDVEEISTVKNKQNYNLECPV